MNKYILIALSTVTLLQPSIHGAEEDTIAQPLIPFEKILEWERGYLAQEADRLEAEDAAIKLHTMDQNISPSLVWTSRKTSAFAALAATATVASHTIAGPALERSIRSSSRVFGIDDILIANAASGIVGSIGSKALSAVPTVLAISVGAYGVYKLNRLLHAECRSHVEQVKYEMKDLLREHDERQRKKYKALIDRYDAQIHHMEEQINAAREHFDEASEELKGIEDVLAETKATNIALKAKVDRALPLVVALSTNVQRMAASARWDLEAAGARMVAEGTAEPAPRIKHPFWQFWKK